MLEMMDVLYVRGVCYMTKIEANVISLLFLNTDTRLKVKVIDDRKNTILILTPIESTLVQDKDKQNIPMAHILRSPSDVAQLLHNSNNDLSKVISLLLRPRSVKTSEVAISKVRNQSRNLHENYNTAAIKTS